MSLTSPVLISSQTSWLSRPPWLMTQPTLQRPFGRAGLAGIFQPMGKCIAAVIADADPSIGLRHRRGDHLLGEFRFGHVPIPLTVVGVGTTRELARMYSLRYCIIPYAKWQGGASDGTGNVEQPARDSAA